MAFIRISAINYVKEDEYSIVPTILNTDEITYITECHIPIKSYDIENDRYENSAIEGSKVYTKNSGYIYTKQSIDELFKMLHPTEKESVYYDEEVIINGFTK